MSAPVGGDELRQRLVQYIGFRLLLATALLIYASLLYGADVGQQGIDPTLALAVVAVTYAGLGTSAYLVRRMERPGRLVLLQLSMDSLAIYSLVFLFGGTSSPFVPLFPAAVLGAAYLDARRGALLSAFINAALLVLLAVLASSGVDPVRAAAVVLTEVFGVFLVGLLAGELASKLTAQTRERAAVEKDLAQVLEHLRVGLVLVDARGEVRASNPAAQALFPQIQGDLVGAIPGYEVGEGPTAWEVDGAGPEQDRTLLLSRSPTDEGGSVLVIEDVTQLRRTQRLSAREERLSAVGRFSQGIAHEIKNPLASLSGALRLMDLSDSDKRLRNIVLREVDRLDRLVTDFRDAGQPAPIRRGPVEICGLLREVSEAFSHDTRYVTARVVTVGLTGEHTLSADEDKLKQALWNLLLNAAQHMPQGGTITLSLEIGECVEIGVEDQGVGIPVEQLPLIFDPFFTRRSGGTGLGLSVVERVVREHGGEIGVKSQVGEGTRFWLRLPVDGLEAEDG